MKLFVRKGYHLASLAVPAKLIYTLFLIFIGLGVWSSFALYSDRIGPDLEGPAGSPSVQERYVNRAPESRTNRDAGPTLHLDGPALDLDDEGPSTTPAIALPTPPSPPEDLKRPWVLDVFHQHLFSVSVVFLILAHLFMLTGLHPAPSGVVIAIAGASSLLHVLAPVIIWKTGGWLWLMPATGATMGLSWSSMILWTFGAMWLGRRAPRSEGVIASP